MAADRTPSDLADRLDQIADPNFPGSIGYTAARDMHAAAALLREQGEQLDTLRNAAARLRAAIEHTASALDFELDGDEFPRAVRASLLDQLAVIDADALAAAGGGVPEEGARFVEVDYWCHFDDKGRATRVHDASTVHMDGCTRMFVCVPEEGATDE